jgi:hypothetical protein
MPSQCIVCSGWFEASACCKECDLLQVYNNLCGQCSGVGPYNQTYVNKPHDHIVRALDAAKFERAEQRRQELEQERAETEERRKALVTSKPRTTRERAIGMVVCQ